MQLCRGWSRAPLSRSPSGEEEGPFFFLTVWLAVTKPGSAPYPSSYLTSDLCFWELMTGKLQGMWWPR